MASSSTLGSAAENNSILTPVMTLDGHEPYFISSSGVKHHEVKVKHISSISYLPDGKQIISSSDDKTIRRWDLREGKEIEEARQVCENGERRVGVSRDGRWVFITGWEELKVSEVETGIVRTFDEGNWITNIDISANSTLLAVGSIDVKTQIRSVEVRIWRLETGELVAGPFKVGYVGALRFSEGSRKLADIQAQKLESLGPCKSIYEFDAPTLGAPFRGHSDTIRRLELSSDCALLPMTTLSSYGPLSPASSSLHSTSKIYSPSSSRPIHANWLTRVGMTPRSTFVTFQPLALGFQKNRSLPNVHATLVYSTLM